MLGIEDDVLHPQFALLDREAHVMGRQLIHHQAGLAVARKDRKDRALPRLHIGVKIGGELEEIRGRENKRVELQIVHHPAHLGAAVVTGFLAEFRHGNPSVDEVNGSGSSRWKCPDDQSPVPRFPRRAASSSSPGWHCPAGARSSGFRGAPPRQDRQRTSAFRRSGAR